MLNTNAHGEMENIKKFRSLKDTLQAEHQVDIKYTDVRLNVKKDSRKYLSESERLTSACFMCFVPCMVMYSQIKHQQNAHVLCIPFRAPLYFGPTGPSSECLLLQNILVSKWASPI